MSHGAQTYSSEDIAKIAEAKPFTVSTSIKVLLYSFIVLGILSFFSEFVAGGDQKVHAWAALHINFVFWFGIAAASSGFAAVLKICDGQWARPIRRIFESAYPFFSFLPLFIIILYFGAESVFVWAREPVHGRYGKAIWLSQNFLYARDFIASVLLVWVIGRVIRGSLMLDITAIRKGLVPMSPSSGAEARWNDRSMEIYEAKGVDTLTAMQKVDDRMGTFSPICVIVFALSMSLIAFDLIMSVDPHWYSTMFGGFHFMSAVYGAVAFVAIMIPILRSQHSMFAVSIKRTTLHDLGKLLFGFGIFWAYLFWCHYLPIWYGNLPEETGYLILRVREYPWRSLAWLILGMCFIIPFALGISKDLKQVPIFLALTGVIVAIGLWLQYHLLFSPSLFPNRISVNINDIGIGLGFLGVYFLSAFSYLNRFPLIPFGDLLLKKKV